METVKTIGGRFRLIEELGFGGFGRVWRAHDERLDVDVAVKEVRLPPSVDQAEVLERAEREARNSARLRGTPNVLPIYDVVVEDGAPWMIMELVDGSSLDVVLKERGRLDIDEVITAAAALLGALRATHAAEIVHRDIKPANVLRAKDGRFLLTDFGISRYETDATITQTGAFVGSPRYTAPERWLGRDAIPASDMFALGVTLYELAEGRWPFSGEEPAAIMRSVLDDAPGPMQHGRRLEGLIARLLAKEPSQRPTAEHAMRMLRETLAVGEAGLADPGAAGSPLSAGSQATAVLSTADSVAGAGVSAGVGAGARPGVPRRFLVAAGALAGVMLLSGVGYASVRPFAYFVSDTLLLSGSAWSIGDGSCLHYDSHAPSYYRTWRSVPCWSAAADYKVLTAETGSTTSALTSCGGGSTAAIDGFTQSEWIRLCLAPAHPPWNPYQG